MGEQVQTSSGGENLHQIITLEELKREAACLQDILEGQLDGTIRSAKAFCVAYCAVRTECLNYALAHDERFGVWGGLSERERRKLKRLT